MHSIIKKKPEVLLSSNNYNQLITFINNILYNMNYLEFNIKYSLIR